MNHVNPNPASILVVDDDPAVAESIAMLLQFDGHTVQRAPGGEEAMALLEQMPFDVVVTDYEMKGMNGSMLAALVRKRFPQLPIILLTAYAEMLHTWGVDLRHITLVLSKPVFLCDLRRSLLELAPSSGARA